MENNKCTEAEIYRAYSQLLHHAKTVPVNCLQRCRGKDRVTINRISIRGNMSPPAKKKFNPENRNNLTTGEYLLYLELGEEEVDRKKE